MGRYVTGLNITTLPSDNSGYTRFEFRGLRSSLYTVTVDSEGLWTCSCKSAKFRNLCYHILAIRTEIERINILKRITPVPVVPVDKRDFKRYSSMDRFIGEAIYEGPRNYVIIGRRVWLGKQRRDDWGHPIDLHVRLAGTVLEGIWDGYGKKRPVFRLIDCLFNKGIDHRLSPLAYRKDLLDSIATMWLPEGVEVAPYYYGADEKQALLDQYGCGLIKDINSTYDRQNQSPRAWMEVRTDGKVRKGRDDSDDSENFF